MSCLNEGAHVGGAHGHDGELDFFPKPSGFDCGTNGVCGGGVWGSIQLKDHSRLTRGQCASILTKQIYNGGKSFGSFRKSFSSYNSSLSLSSMNLGSSQISPCHPLVFFQPIPLILVIPKSTSLNSSHTQDPSLGINNQILRHPWEQSPPQSMTSMDDPMDGEQLDVVVQMTLYMPFNTKKGQRGLAHVVSILTSIKKADIVKHVFKALRGEMGLMQI